MVRPVSATRRRAPGGSFIWPKTIAVLSMTPDSLHLLVEVVAFAGALAHAGEDREAAVLVGDVADQLHDQDRLAHAGAAEEADLAAPGIGAIRSTTLMPVSRISVAGSHCSSTAGAGRWIG